MALGPGGYFSGVLPPLTPSAMERSGLHHRLPLPVVPVRKLYGVDVKAFEKLTTRPGAAESPLTGCKEDEVPVVALPLPSSSLSL